MSDKGFRFDTGFIDDIARKLNDALPKAARDMQDDIQKNFRSVLQSTLSRLDLVTREEFDVQAAVLERTREKLEALERRLAEMEGAGDD